MKKEKPEDDKLFVKFLQNMGIDPKKFTTDELEALYKDYEGEREILNSREAVAREMMGTGSPDGRTVNGQYIAASPLEHFGNLAQKGVGAYQQRGVNQDRKKLSEQNATGRGAYARELANAIRSQGAAAAPSTSGAPATPQTPSQAPRMASQSAAPRPAMPAPAPAPAGPSPAPQAAPQPAPQQAGPVPPSTPQIFRPGPQQGGMTPAPQEHWMAEALRAAQSDSPQTVQQQMAMQRKKEEEERKRKLEMKTAFLNDSFGGY